MAKQKIYVKANKNKGICDILINDVRTAECKRTLNMFAGQDIRLALRSCLTYVRLLLEGDERSISEIHYNWNHHEKA